ncbi:hypothetical protein LSUE1_G009434 [Lachnellula suecica]|uniref:2EXR domain-containing protein n=1 Tax=Lachnellula suecica TaxID=602035 RepID=A0A8T9BSK7_9HELO|nr:hypothetical protein LSUE1_G009434 [Lachnellula suecica]
MSFTLFPQLPLELRLKIWQHILPAPRTVNIQYKMKYDKFDGKTVGSFTGWTSPTPIPLGLRICRESRDETLKHYQRSFGSYFHPSKIYFDFSKDTLRFGDEEGTTNNYLLDVFLGGGYHGANDVEKVKKMVVGINDELYGRRYFIWNEIRLFRSLRELTVMVWEQDVATEEIMRHYRSSLRNVRVAHLSGCSSHFGGVCGDWDGVGTTGFLLAFGADLSRIFVVARFSSSPSYWLLGDV